MIRKNLVIGSIVLGLVSLLLLLGCPTGSSPNLLDPGDTPNHNPPGDTDTKDKTAATAAAALATLLNGDSSGEPLVKVEGTTVTLLQDIEIQPPYLASMSRAVIPPNGVFPIASGVTLQVPAGKTLTLANSLTVTVEAGARLAVTGRESTIAVHAAITNKGAIDVGQYGKIVVYASIDVAAGATVTAEENSAVTIETGGKIAVTGGIVTARANSKIEMKASGGLTVSAGSVAVAAGAKIDKGKIITSGTGCITDDTGKNSTDPVVQNIEVSYPSPGYQATVKYTFDQAVTNPHTLVEEDLKSPFLDPEALGATPEDLEELLKDPEMLKEIVAAWEEMWAFTTEGTVVTATYQGEGAGDPQFLAFKVDGSDVIYWRMVYTVSGAVMPATGKYRFVHYETLTDKDSIVGLRAESEGGHSSATYYYLEGGNYDKYHPVFNAIYTPNAPFTTDAIESGKHAMPYTKDLSDRVMSLFTINFDPGKLTDNGHKSSHYGDAGFIVQITDELPDADEFKVGTNVIVIDVGIPGEANAVKFYLPHMEFGASNKSLDYSHIRLRVNEGAELVIEANNAGYVTEGAGNPCDTGSFKNGRIEVMAGGIVRNAAFEGFPLGEGAAILNRKGSFLSMGPEPLSADATGVKAEAYAADYAGYLLGPADGSPRIVWGDNPAAAYLEVRDGAVATNARLTVKKRTALGYSVWFADGAGLTIDAAGGQVYANERTNLPERDYNFYGNTNTVLTIHTGGILDKRFLTLGPGDDEDPLTAAKETEIRGMNTGNPASYPGGNITGYLIPPPEDTPENG